MVARQNANAMDKLYCGRLYVSNNDCEAQGRWAAMPLCDVSDLVMYSNKAEAQYLKLDHYVVICMKRCGRKGCWKPACSHIDRRAHSSKSTSQFTLMCMPSGLAS